MDDPLEGGEETTDCGIGGIGGGGGAGGGAMSRGTDLGLRPPLLPGPEPLRFPLEAPLGGVMSC